jgi:hypothetical protein
MSQTLFHSLRGFTFALVVFAAAPLLAEIPDYEQPPINYSATAPHDPVTPLVNAVDSGKIVLPRDPHTGYLAAVLRELKISPASQTLVFSKTSFQRDRISPTRPRAIYFNDDTYVGYVPGGGDIEIASTDPTLGATFYTIDQAPAPKLMRETDNCLSCHGQSMTRDIPGLLMRSVFTDSDGQPILSAGTFLTTQDSPLAERWGGWYVTGSLSKQLNMGNTLWQPEDGRDPAPIQPPPTDGKTLPRDVDTSLYLSPDSDAVALMVLAHQVEAHNTIVRAVHGTLRALRDEKVIADALGEPIKPGVHSDSTNHRIQSSCEPLVQYLLFAGEPPLAGPISGTSSFAADFAARGPRDPKGRSLRDFDLKSRLFRYPCSYLIYSSAIDHMPPDAKQYVYRRLWEILTGKDKNPDKSAAHLSPADQKSVYEILRDTSPAIRTDWASLEK